MLQCNHLLVKPESFPSRSAVGPFTIFLGCAERSQQRIWGFSLVFKLLTFNFKLKIWWDLIASGGISSLQQGSHFTNQKQKIWRQTLQDAFRSFLSDVLLRPKEVLLMQLFKMMVWKTPKESKAENSDQTFYFQTCKCIMNTPQCSESKHKDFFLQILFTLQKENR